MLKTFLRARITQRVLDVPRVHVRVEERRQAALDVAVAATRQPPGPTERSKLFLFRRLQVSGCVGPRSTPYADSSTSKIELMKFASLFLRRLVVEPALGVLPQVKAKVRLEGKAGSSS